MATINTIHPVSIVENSYQYLTEEILDSNIIDGSEPRLMYELVEKITGAIKALPLFNTNTGEFTRYIDLYNDWSWSGHYRGPAYKTDFNNVSGTSFCVMLSDKADNTGSGIKSIFLHIGMDLGNNSMYNVDYQDSTVMAHNTIAIGLSNRDAFNWAHLEDFRMVTYISQSTNGFWFPNVSSDSHTKFLITKVVSIDDPTTIKYFPAVFNYSPNSMMSSSLSNNGLYDANAARIFDGSEFKVFYSANQSSTNRSSSYILKPLILNEWQFTDIYTIEGGIVPVYNSLGSTIRIGNNSFIFLSNSYLLKITD